VKNWIAFWKKVKKKAVPTSVVRTALIKSFDEILGFDSMIG